MHIRPMAAALALACASALTAQIQTTREVYKTIGDVELTIDVVAPASSAASERRPAIVFFFGGGWTSGTIEQFRPQAEHLARRGMVAALADYRVRSRHKTSPFACVADGKSAVRWLRANSARLGVDPERVAAGGGSAGGHVAAAAGVIQGLEEAGEDAAVSSRPDALVLFNPVFDNGPSGWGHSRVKQRWREISPMHNIATGAPPTTVFLGSNDKLIPVATARAYQQRMQAVDARCDVHIYEGQGHGFFNKKRDAASFDATVAEMDRFLVSLGWLQALTSAPPIQLTDLRWPAAPRLYRNEQLKRGELDRTGPQLKTLNVTTMLPMLDGLSGFERLQQLCVAPGARSWGGYISKGEDGEVARLGHLRDVPSLRRLRLTRSPTRPRDLAALAALPDLEVLELAMLFGGDLARLKEQAQAGGNMPFRAFDVALAEAVAQYSAAQVLVLEQMSVSADALRALAAGSLDTLAISGPTPDGLEAIGALQTLRQVSIGYASAPPEPGGWIAAFLASQTPRKQPRGTFAPSLTAGLAASLARLPNLEAVTLRSCLLSDAVIQSLPRQLKRLDLYDCFGVTARLVDVVAEMPALRELGLPLQVGAGARARRAGRGSPRIRTQGSDLHERRLASADAARIVRSRQWRRLRLDGTLTPELAAALKDQRELVELRLTLDDASAPLDFVAALPKLQRVVFEDMHASAALVAPLAECAALQEAVFDDCFRYDRDFQHGLPERVRARFFTRRFQ